MKISRFPEFIPLSFDLRKQIEDIVGVYEPYSDFNFVSLYSWNTNDITEVSLLNGNLIVCFLDYISGEKIYSVIGDKEIDNTLQELLSLTPTLHIVPEIVVQSISDPTRFIVTADMDNHDYIYSVNDLALFSGKEYKKKRNGLNSFEKEFPVGLFVTNMSKIPPDKIEEIRAIFNHWQDKSEQSSRDLAMESSAFDRLLDNLDEFKLILTEVTINNTPAAFSINEIVSQDFAVCHFEKARDVHDYLYTFLVNQVAKRLLSAGCKYVNWEQDLGIEGLRRSKRSYNPCRMLKKYTIESAGKTTTPML